MSTADLPSNTGATIRVILDPDTDVRELADTIVDRARAIGATDVSTFDIETLVLRPDETLIVAVSGPVTAEQLDRLHRQLAAALPLDRFVLVHGNVRLGAHPAAGAPLIELHDDGSTSHQEHSR